VARPLGRGEWANLSFRKSVWLEIGGFRQDFGMVGRSPSQLGNDELEFIQRAGRSSKNFAWYSPKVKVSHRVCASRTTIEWFEWRAYGQGRSDIALLKIMERGADGHRLYRALGDYAAQFESEQERRRSFVDEDSALQFRDNLFRCRLAQLHGVFDAIVSSGQRFTACNNAPDVYRAGILVIDQQLCSNPRASAHQLFEQARQRLCNRGDNGGGDHSPEFWLCELAGMRDEIVSRVVRPTVGVVSMRCGPGGSNPKAK
jgi:hypothetical protein